MKRYLVARDNKLTGRRGVMGAIEVEASDASTERIVRNGPHSYFPLSAAARARSFQLVDAEDWQSMMDKCGGWIG